jgi:hypothetical protein
MSQKTASHDLQSSVYIVVSTVWSACPSFWGKDWRHNASSIIFILIFFYRVNGEIMASGMNGMLGESGKNMGKKIVWRCQSSLRNTKCAIRSLEGTRRTGSELYTGTDRLMCNNKLATECKYVLNQKRQNKKTNRNFESQCKSFIFDVAYISIWSRHSTFNL